MKQSKRTRFQLRSSYGTPIRILSLPKDYTRVLILGVEVATILLLMSCLRKQTMSWILWGCSGNQIVVHRRGKNYSPVEHIYWGAPVHGNYHICFSW